MESNTANTIHNVQVSGCRLQDAASVDVQTSASGLLRANHANDNWIGDFPQDLTGLGKLKLIPNINVYPTWPEWTDYTPMLWPWGASASYISYPQPWRVTATDEQLTLALDLPGVKIADLSVVIDVLLVKVSGKRFDSGASLLYTYILQNTWDARSAEATLEAGILTMKFSRAKDQVLHKVTVTQGEK